MTDILFKTVGDQKLLADIYSPRNVVGELPAVIVVHGGGWARRSGDMSTICRRLAKEGFIAINVTYRLANKYHYPDPVDDVRDAISFFKKNAAQFHIDTRRMYGWGYSAGANLILLAGLDGNVGLKAIVAGGTPADLMAWPKSPLVLNFIGKSQQDGREQWQLASPVNHVKANSPPVFLYHGEWDKLVEVEQMFKMEKALREKDIHVETYRVKFQGHISTYFFSENSIEKGIEFLRKY